MFVVDFIPTYFPGIERSVLLVFLFLFLFLFFKAIAVELTTDRMSGCLKPLINIYNRARVRKSTVMVCVRRERR